MIGTTKLYYLIFGILSVLGGWLGYRNARNVGFLVSGLLCGVALIVAAFLLPFSLHVSLILGLTACVVVLGAFLPDLLQRRSKPHVHLAVFLSALGVIITILTWYHHR